MYNITINQSFACVKRFRQFGAGCSRSALLYILCIQSVFAAVDAYEQVGGCQVEVDVLTRELPRQVDFTVCVKNGEFDKSCRSHFVCIAT